MLMWKIYKGNNENEFVFVWTESFDEALKIARKIDNNFNSGYIIDIENLPKYNAVNVTKSHFTE